VANLFIWLGTLSVVIVVVIGVAKWASGKSAGHATVPRSLWLPGHHTARASWSICGHRPRSATCQQQT